MIYVSIFSYLFFMMFKSRSSLFIFCHFFNEHITIISQWQQIVFFRYNLLISCHKYSSPFISLHCIPTIIVNILLHLLINNLLQIKLLNRCLFLSIIFICILAMIIVGKYSSPLLFLYVSMALRLSLFSLLVRFIEVLFFVYYCILGCVKCMTLILLMIVSVIIVFILSVLVIFLLVRDLL